MRIIAGQWRGRKLVSPPGIGTRPTSERAREALFSMLGSRIGSFEGLRVADLFAGSGALGLEALSRGAGHCIFVERERDAVAAIRVNVAALGADAEIVAGDAATARIAGPIDLAFLDPPYGSGLWRSALGGIEMAESGWASIETGGGESVDVPGYEVETVRRHGKAVLTLLRRCQG